MQFEATNKDLRDIDYPDGEAYRCKLGLYCKNNEICDVLSCEDFRTRVEKKVELFQEDMSEEDIG